MTCMYRYLINVSNCLCYPWLQVSDSGKSCNKMVILSNRTDLNKLKMYRYNE